MKILFVCPYPTGRIASQRFRFEQYFSVLTKQGINYEVAPFGSPGDWQAGSSSSHFSKLQWILKGLLSRIKLLARLRTFDFIFVHREMAPAGPPIFEWLTARISGKKIIYDFDDAIWLTDKIDESTIEKVFRWRGKVRSICKWSYKVSCGNRYLAEYARKFNPGVFLNPTTIDTDHQHYPRVVSDAKTGGVTIGWTGSRTTLKYLQSLNPVLQALEDKYPQTNFLIIADQDPGLTLRNVVFRQWHPTTEIDDLAMMDIGIMPLPDDAWTQGKGGFKALQYMAMGKPAVASPVGINSEIISQGVEGFLCATDDEWFACLEELIVNRALRIEMGQKGRMKVIARYSVVSNADNFLSLFE